MSNTKSPDSGASKRDVDDVDVAATTNEHAPDDGAAPRSRALLWLVAVAVLIVDQVTKIWAAAELVDRDIDLFWTARFHLIRNHGSAFGLGAGLGRWLAILIVGVVVGLLWYARRVTDRRMLALFGAIVGGAVGNLIDRLARADDGFLSGGVVDFIDFQWWPVFNVADMAVVCGAIGLVVLSMREPA